jgi:hypothetical protein
MLADSRQKTLYGRATARGPARKPIRSLQNSETIRGKTLHREAEVGLAKI